MRCRCGWGGEGIIKERRVVSGGSVGRWECCRLCVYQDILVGGLLWVEIGVDNVIYTLTHINSCLLSVFCDIRMIFGDKICG